MTEIYINRRIKIGDKSFTEAEALNEGKVLIVLAEPGAGKTELLREFARLLQVTPVRASIFRHRSAPAALGPIVIDALDEAAKIDLSSIDQIIVKAQEFSNGHVIFASRSDGWNQNRTKSVKDCFHVDPVIIRIESMNEQEQKMLFNHYQQGEIFADFLKEANRFELSPLLGNPQFLKLFSDAYVQSGRHFTSKAQIFKDAIDRLAVEEGSITHVPQRPAISDIIGRASEFMAKILLSDASGLSAVERLGDNDYPYIGILASAPHPSDAFLLSTRLFKPAINEDQHEPVHRIVAEYCTAQYIVRQINEPTRPLSLRRCLAVMAPNGVVRDELRGVLGWMAAIGSVDLQRVLIELDSYTVLANGDPSQLAAPSKKLLLNKLRTLSEEYPGFQRSDAWRHFSVSGFFDTTIVDDLKSLLTTLPSGSRLLVLILQLLQDSGTLPDISTEVRAVMLNPDMDSHTRYLAMRVLCKVANENLIQDVSLLTHEASPASLPIAADAVVISGTDKFPDTEILSILRGFSTLYPNTNQRRQSSDRISTYPLRGMINLLSPTQAASHLDALTNGLACTCGHPDYECYCRSGISKVAGRLLDRYFDTTLEPHDPRRIWGWTRGLWYNGYHSSEKGASVQTLSQNHELRRQLHQLAFSEPTSGDGFWNIRLQLQGNCHSGLSLMDGDFEALAQFGFDSDNVELWAGFWQSHLLRQHIQVPHSYRALLRHHSRQKPAFAARWAKIERANKEFRQKQKRQYGHRRRSVRVVDHDGKVEFFKKYIPDNLDAISKGENWRFLNEFSFFYLASPDRIADFSVDLPFVERSLRQCLPFMQPHIPTLEERALNQKSNIARVLHAACLAIYRAQGNLDTVDRSILIAAKTDTGGYSGISDEEREAFEVELDRILFPSIEELNNFARIYIEPGLGWLPDAQTHVGWLRYKNAFRALQASLPLEWLSRFPNMPVSARYDLFNMAAVAGDHNALRSVIGQYGQSLNICQIPSNDEERKRDRDTQFFWHIRRFFFTADDNDSWDFLRTDSENIFLVDNHVGRFGDGGTEGWPDLTAEKIYRILDTNVEVWPQVPLPSSWGTHDPPDERAYRFLSDLIWKVGRDIPTKALPVLERMLMDSRFAHFSETLKTLRAESIRKMALLDFTAPKPAEIAAMFDRRGVATVEDLRSLLLDELMNLQTRLKTAETDPLQTFYSGGVRVNENTSRNRIVDQLHPRLTAMNLPVQIEHHMANSNRCDITVTAMIDGRRRLLVIEVKGQWHGALYTAASAQLNERYASHQDAEQQGIYLVLWFGPQEDVAGRSGHGITSAAELRTHIVADMPAELRGLIDVFVLDVSR